MKAKNEDEVDSNVKKDEVKKKTKKTKSNNEIQKTERKMKYSKEEKPVRKETVETETEIIHNFHSNPSIDTQTILKSSVKLAKVPSSSQNSPSNRSENEEENAKLTKSEKEIEIMGKNRIKTAEIIKNCKDDLHFEFTIENSILLAKLSFLAYQNEAYVKRKLKTWGLYKKGSKLIFLDKEETHAIYFEDNKRIFIIFRGTQGNVADYFTNFKFLPSSGPFPGFFFFFIYYYLINYYYFLNI